MIKFCVGGAVGIVIRKVAIPGRAINAELDAAGFARIGELAHDIAFAVFPRATFYAVTRGGGGP